MLSGAFKLIQFRHVRLQSWWRLLCNCMHVVLNLMITFSRNVLSSITEPLQYIAWSALVYGLMGAVRCASGGLHITETSPGHPFVMLQVLCCRSDNDQFDNRKGFPCFEPNLNHYVCIICPGWTIYREGGFKFVTLGCSKDSVHMSVPRGKEWFCMRLFSAAVCGFQVCSASAQCCSRGNNLAVFHNSSV